MAGVQKVFLRVVALTGDGPDDDEMPDRVLVTGRGSFVPTMAAGTGDVTQGPDALQEIRLVEPIDFEIVNGMLTYGGEPFVWLPVPTGQWQWRATFEPLRFGEQIRTLDDFVFPLDAATEQQIADPSYPGINLALYGVSSWEPGTVNLTAEAIQQITIMLGRASNAAITAEGHADRAESTIGYLDSQAERAETARTGAETSEAAAKASETAAKASETAAKTSETNAKASETNAKASETAAGTARTGAETARTDAETARTGAETARDAAEGSASAAAQSASDASGSASAAAASETEAEGHRDQALSYSQDANDSADAAASSAAAADGSATAASTDAGRARQYRDAAGAHANSASSDATAAAQSATAADGSASEAAGSASDALGYRNAAQTAATEASTSASNAAGSASDAAGSATAAAGSASAAAGSEASVAADADAAQSAASDSSGHASNAASSASAAAGSASAASQSAGSAEDDRVLAEDAASRAEGHAEDAGLDASRAEDAAAVAEAQRWTIRGDWSAGAYDAGDVVVYEERAYYAETATSVEPPAQPWIPLTPAGGGGASHWADLDGKPTAFPPEAHTHNAAEVTGEATPLLDVSEAMAMAESAFGSLSVADLASTTIDIATALPMDVGTYPDRISALESGKSDVDHSHTTADVDGLQAALDETADASRLEGALTLAVNVHDAVWTLSVPGLGDYDVPLGASLVSFNTTLDSLVDQETGDISHTHDGADITGALTDQVDASYAIVRDVHGMVGADLPLSDMLAGMAGNAALLEDKSDVGHQHAIADTDGLQAALDDKADEDHTHAKAEVGLGDVDNTSDANKPVSTATQAALTPLQNRVGAAPATWRWNGTSLPTAASQVHAQARVGDFIVAPNLTADPGWHQITGV